LSKNENDPKKITIPIQILYRKSSQNNPNQNKNQEIKPKNFTYQKKKGFSTVWVPRKCQNSSFLASLALGRDPPAPAPSPAPNGG
jgi:hypothetical protein